MAPREGIASRMRRGVAAAFAAAGLVAGSPLLAASAAARADSLASLCLATNMSVAPGAVWSAWSLAPATLLPILAVALLYLFGRTRLARAGAGGKPASGRPDAGAMPAPRSPAAIRPSPHAGRGTGPAGRPPLVRDSTALAAWLLLLVALVSPLCRLAATLVAAHMAQFMLIIGPASLLAALARPWPAIHAALPPRLAARFTQAGTGNGLRLAAVLYGALIWLWHAPPVYEAVLTSPLVHLAMVAALLAVSVAFWHAVLGDRGPGAVLALFATMVHTGLLGAILTFSRAAFYPVLADGAFLWGMEPLADQALAGLIMWVAGGILYLSAAVALFALWLRGLGREGPVSA